MVESVNTTVVAVPVADVMFFESDTGTTHLVNTVDAYREEPLPSAQEDGETYTITSMCGRASVEVPHGTRPKDADALTHVSEVLTPSLVNDSPGLINDPHNVLDDVCGSCEASWSKAFSNGNYQTVRYEL